jgi:hypothetical protein
MGGIPKSAHCFPRVSSQRVAELRKACLAHGINSPLAKVPQNVSRASAWIHFPIRTSDSFTGVHSFVCYVAFVAAPSGAEKVALMPQRTLLQEDTPSSSKLRVTSALWPGSTTAELKKKLKTTASRSGIVTRRNPLSRSSPSPTGRKGPHRKKRTRCTCANRLTVIKMNKMHQVPSLSLIFF